MLAVILSVLKTIGIVLLIVLLIAIFLALVVLFVPIRYRIKGDYPKTVFADGEGFDKEKAFLSVKFSWLLHIVSGGLVHPDNTEFVVRLFGIRIFPRKKKAEKPEVDKKEKKDRKDKHKKEESAEDTGDKGKKPAVIVKTEGFGDDDTDISETAEKVTEFNNGSNGNIENYAGEEDEEDEESFFDKLGKLAKAASELIRRPQHVFVKIRYTIFRLCDKISMIKTTLENPIFERAYNLVKAKLIRLIKMILPDKYNVEVYFGAGDPATEAELMAVYGVLYPILFDNLKFIPDFENRALGADIDLKGHITVFTVIYCVAVCYFNKDVKKVIKRFKKIMNS